MREPQSKIYEPEGYWEARLRDRFTLGRVGYSTLGEGINHWLYRVRRRVLLRALDQLGVHPDATVWVRRACPLGHKFAAYEAIKDQSSRAVNDRCETYL